MNEKEIGKILSDLRKKAGLSRMDVAQFVGKSDKTIGHWETGRIKVDANMLFTLCKLYGTSVNEAFGFEKKEKAESPHQDSVLLNAFHKAPAEIQNIVLTALAPYMQEASPKAG